MYIINTNTTSIYIMSNAANEDELIVLVKQQNDSHALYQLITKYRPMIDNMYKMYWLNGYDQNDWYQESYIVCYETCCNYNGDLGSRFANFFKMRFSNHIISLIRSQQTAKRQINAEASSFEELLSNGDVIIDYLHEPAPRSMDLLFEIESMIEGLSNLELAAFLVILGDRTMEEACKMHKISEKQLIRAASRCKAKIMKNLHHKDDDDEDEKSKVETLPKN